MGMETPMEKNPILLSFPDMIEVSESRENCGFILERCIA
ncbi:hypothetical protein PVOR_19564 [Paenibacillus vortex V453]|uniref:Uncharacterized protein n=1 Tax=Paenibacillus vortex V453 TaxID=715225 RepID=A0A2R9SSP5_9BACL|nr:hypothetical protein PVOR_19564 [Paenibacillus vortex V453]